MEHDEPDRASVIANVRRAAGAIDDARSKLERASVALWAMLDDFDDDDDLTE